MNMEVIQSPVLFSVSDTPRFSVDQQLPIAFQRVIAVCRSFKGLGYIDVEETWHYDADDQEIHDVIAWEDC